MKALTKINRLKFKSSVQYLFTDKNDLENTYCISVSRVYQVDEFERDKKLNRVF